MGVFNCFWNENEKNNSRHGIIDRSVPEQQAELLRRGMASEKCMIINADEDDEMEIRGYKNNLFKTILTYIGIVLTAGCLRLFFHWVPHWYLYATCSHCPVTDADQILITELFNIKHKIYHVKKLKALTLDNVNEMNKKDNEMNHMHKFMEQSVSLTVHFEKGIFTEIDRLLFFTCKKVTYVWNPEKYQFGKLLGLDEGVSSSVFHENKGLSSCEQFMRRLVYGPNKILVRESSVVKLLFLEVLNPFYIFQIASFILWFLEDYYYYAAAIFLMSIFGVTMTVLQTRKNEKNLKSTVHSSDVCTVVRKVPKINPDDEVQEVPSNTDVISTELLVPGDILEIPAHGCIMHCDALLLTGNCILNESMLTGESVPVTKTSIPNVASIPYDPKEHAKHTLFCGTHVIQTRYFGTEKVLAVVVRTGFSTAKGSLVRSILYPPPVDFKFEKDSYKFVTLMAGIAGLGFIYTVVTKVMRSVPVMDLLLEAADLITIVIPPALPAAMTVGSFYAQSRLKKNQIFCISPRAINVSGSVNCVCFDKTGTLTEDGLDLLCVVPKEDRLFAPPIDVVETLPYNTLLCGLVSCHSLTIIDKQIVGDPLDLKMFESTKWIMEEYDVADTNKFNMMFPTVLKPPKNKCLENQNAEDDELQIGIIREFPFSSSLQRMGVIIRKLSAQHFEYYCKGSPEMLLNFVRRSTIPDNFSEILENYTQDGCRVIAIAHKELKLSYAKLQKVQREVVEKDMDFLGLIVLENRLKTDTTPCIQILNDANIRVVMVTGDNILTAISVAKDCDILKQGESVITINSDHSEPPQLYYTLNNFKNKIGQNGTSILSNSASVVSLETIESQIQTITNNSSNRSKYNGKLDTLCNNYRFAMTGKVWGIVREYYPDELMAKLVTRGTIFARMSPEQKQQLVQELQGLGYYVAMCGDGANDCGALKAAHTGVSLSEAESSVASPFTSKVPNISCVLNVIREGRAALVTSFGIFKYMAAYSLCQFISVLILYSIDSNLTDMEYLYIDLCIISIFAFFFGKTRSYPGKLVKETPLSSLISFSPVLSLLLQLVLIIVFQVGAFEYVKTQPWYVPYDKSTRDDKDDVACLENYTVYTISVFQYIGLAIIFSKGKPYRRSIFSNLGFIISAVFLTVFSVYMALVPADFIKDKFQLVIPDSWQFRIILLVLAGVNFILSLLIEYVIVDNLVFKKLRFKFHNIDKSKKKYLAIERDLNLNTKWPPLTSDFKSAASPDNTMPTCTAEIVVEKENKFDKNHVLNKLYQQTKLDYSPGESSLASNSENFSSNTYTFSTPLNTKLTDNTLKENASSDITELNQSSSSRLYDRLQEDNLQLTEGNPNSVNSVTKLINNDSSFVCSDSSDLNNVINDSPRVSKSRLVPNFKTNLPVRDASPYHQSNATNDDLFSSLPSVSNQSSSSETFKSFSPSHAGNDLMNSQMDIAELPYDFEVTGSNSQDNFSTKNTGTLEIDIPETGNNSINLEMNNFQYR